MALDLTDKTVNGNNFSVTAGTVTEETSDKPSVTGNLSDANFDISSTLTCVNDFTSIDSSDFTIELWLKQKGTVGDRILASKGGFAGMNFYIQNDDKIVTQINSTSASSTGTVTDVDWIHIALVYTKSAGSVIYYKNGSSVETISGLDTNGLPNNASVLSVTAPADNGFYIDEYRVWSDVRTAGEISANYNVRLIGNEANLVMYVPFESLTTTGEVGRGYSFII